MKRNKINTKKLKKNIDKSSKGIRKIFKNLKNYLKEKKYYLYIVISFLIGIIFTFSIITIILGKNFVSIKKDLGKVIDTYYTITDNYYGNIDKNKVIENSINGIIYSIDDAYTNYSNKNISDDLNEQLKGNYHGIGASVVTYSSGNITVLDVFKGSPSDKAGLKKNDIIIKIDNIDLKDKDGSYLANYVKNSNKKEIKLVIKRENEEKEISIKLDNIDIPNVKSEVLNDNIGYINVSLFSADTYKQFKSNLEDIEKKNIKSLIIDLRNNTGGYLDEATDIANLFLKKESYIYGLYDNKKINNVKDKTKECRKYPVVILINRESASASELLAMSLKESYGAKIVGTKSYGKGTVQEIKKFDDGSMLKYTTKKWLTPNGNSINGIGITPDIYIEMNDEYYKDLNRDNDNQLKEAINVLNKN